MEQAEIRGTSASTLKKVQSHAKRLVDAGFPLDTPLEEFNTPEAIKDLATWARKTYTGKSGAGTFASSIKSIINAGKPADVSNAISNHEEKYAAKGKEQLSSLEFGIRKTRVSKQLRLPDFKDFSNAINAATLALEKTDIEGKAALQLKNLTGLRNVDIFNLSLMPDPASPYGYFDLEAGTLRGIGNKGVTIDYDLGQEATGVLKELAERAKKAGRNKLFSQTEATIANRINTAVRGVFVDRGLEVVDRTTNTVVDFTLGNLRKNIFDILDEELGSDQANKVLGHGSKGDMGLDHYKVERAAPKGGGEKRLSKVAAAGELFTALYFRAINQSNPKKLFKSYGFNPKSFLTKLRSPLEPTTPAQAVQQDTEQTATKQGSDVRKTLDQTKQDLADLEQLQGRIDELREADQPPPTDSEVPNSGDLKYKPDAVKSALARAKLFAKSAADKGIKGVGFLAAGEITSRVLGNLSKGDVGGAAAATAELVVPAPVEEMFRDVTSAEQRQLRQEQQTMYGEGKPVFGETIQKGAERIGEQVESLFNREPDSQEPVSGQMDKLNLN
jgi:hypothetical protein